MKNEGLGHCPRVSLPEALELAKVLYKHGGEARAALCAAELGYQKMTREFEARKEAARSYSLITEARRVLTATPLALTIFAQTNEDERQFSLQQAFLSCDAFAAIACRLAGNDTVGHDDVASLSGECGIETKQHDLLARVFLDGAAFCGLLVGNAKVGYRKAVRSTEPAPTDQHAPPTSKATSRQKARAICVRETDNASSPADSGARNALVVNININLSPETKPKAVLNLIRELSHLE